MKARRSLQNQTDNPELASHFNTISNTMLQQYKKHGETTKCIVVIQDQIEKYYHSRLINHTEIQRIVEEYFNKYANTELQHIVCRIVENEDIKVSLHLTGAGLKIPVHSHPGSLNSLLVVKGALSIKQYCLIDTKLSAKDAVLKRNTCSVGLQKQYNTHALEATTPFNVFFTIRCKVTNRSINYLIKKKLSTLFTLGFFLLASPASYTLPETINRPVYEIKHDREVLFYANKLRKNNEEDQYNAATIYQKYANQNNPEAQYWLGYMYLQGIGITEDDDEALKWIAASAEQEYAPATKLLNYILTAEVALDC